MTILILIIVTGLVILASIIGLTDYKEKELEYRKTNDVEIRKTVEASTNLEREKEKTKQEVEKTKQLKIKQECLEKHNRYV